MLIMAREKGMGGRSPLPAYIVSWMAEAAGGRVAKHLARVVQTLTWGFPPYPKAV